MNITCHSNQLFAHRILNSSQVRVSIFPGFVLNNIQPPNKDISQFSPYPYPRCLQQARYMWVIIINLTLFHRSFFCNSMQGGIRESSGTVLKHLSKDKIHIFLTTRSVKEVFYTNLITIQRWSNKSKLVEFSAIESRAGCFEKSRAIQQFTILVDICSETTESYFASDIRM